jgi:hypothetical protein
MYDEDYEPLDPSEEYDEITLYEFYMQELSYHEEMIDDIKKSIKELNLNDKNNRDNKNT